jgi:hypothetical protein
MTYAQLLGLEEDIPDHEVIRLLKSGELDMKINDTRIRRSNMTAEGVSGYFGERRAS